MLNIPQKLSAAQKPGKSFVSQKLVQLGIPTGA